MCGEQKDEGIVSKSSLTDTSAPFFLTQVQQDGSKVNAAIICKVQMSNNVCCKSNNQLSTFIKNRNKQGKIRFYTREALLISDNIKLFKKKNHTANSTL